MEALLQLQPVHRSRWKHPSSGCASPSLIPGNARARAVSPLAILPLNSTALLYVLLIGVADAQLKRSRLTVSGADMEPRQRRQCLHVNWSCLMQGEDRTQADFRGVCTAACAKVRRISVQLCRAYCPYTHDAAHTALCLPHRSCALGKAAPLARARQS